MWRMPQFYGSAIGGLWGIFVLYWVVSMFGNKRTVYRSNPAWRLGIAILVYLVFRYAYLWPASLESMPENTAIRVTGLIMCAAGLAIAIWARRTLGANWSGNPSIKAGHELIRSGPYNVVRHPIYSGLLLMSLGTFVTDGRWIYLWAFGFAAVALFFKLKVEESLMMQTFPVEYPEYKKRTKALVPFVI
jgi:protein-S-isoprenylcysteine O-methyltransferase Ste14